MPKLSSNRFSSQGKNQSTIAIRKKENLHTYTQYSVSGIHSQSSRSSKCHGHVSSSAPHSTQLVFQAPADSPPLQRQCSLVIPWSWHLQNTGVSCCKWAELSPTASPGLFHDASASLLGCFSLWALTTPEASPSPETSQR